MRQVTLFTIVLHSRSILKVHSVIEVSSARSYILKVVFTMLCYSAHSSKPQYTSSLSLLCMCALISTQLLIPKMGTLSHISLPTQLKWINRFLLLVPQLYVNDNTAYYAYHPPDQLARMRQMEIIQCLSLHNYITPTRSIHTPRLRVSIKTQNLPNHQTSYTDILALTPLRGLTYQQHTSWLLMYTFKGLRTFARLYCLTPIRVLNRMS